jgi:hypothetical protein
MVMMKALSPEPVFAYILILLRAFRQESQLRKHTQGILSGKPAS